ETALQTSVYTLVSKDTNVRLKIIGVVHVADKEYYLNIQKIINELDFLYYEGIRVSSKMHSKNFSKNYYAQTLEEMDTRRSIKKYSDLKSEIARFLNFADQSELLKPKQNWINADMDFQQFVEMLKNYKIGFDSLSTNFSNDSKSISKDYSELMQMENTDSAEYSTKVLSFKKKMSQNLVKSAFDLCFLEEMRLPREAIIIERNKIALSFVKPKFNSQVPLELGLLYGAAHTPNFVEILTREYNFEIESYEWLDAWSLQN
ncbi:MAG TPA: hypothetical protein PKD50_20415, partial [Leptospiraceae bacterium]|nr:hypothetical protein [Leptospiraceae bacterium]